MATVTKIGELAAMEPDQIVYAIRAQIIGVGKRFAGSGENGDWSFQDITITDGQTKATMCLKDRDELGKEMLNREIVVEAYHGDKGWSGVKVKDVEDKQGNVRRKLWVTKTGTITVADGQPAQPGPAETRQAQPAHRPKSSDPVADMKQFTARAASGMILVVGAVRYVGEQMATRYGQQITDDQFQAMCSTLFIAADRRGLIDSLPVALPLGKPEAVEKDEVPL